MYIKIKTVVFITTCIIALSLSVACDNNQTDSSKADSNIASSAISDTETDISSENGTIEEGPANEKPTTEFSDTKLDKYKFVWGDEFDGDTLELSKWIIKEHSTRGTDILQFELGNENLSKVFSIKDGIATQSFRRWYDPTNTLIQYAGCADMMTRPTMSYQYGYLEVRLRMSFRKDQNAIWLVSTDALNANKNAYCDLEVDVFETLALTDSVTPNIHLWYADGRHTDYNGTYLKGNSTRYYFKETYNLANEFHTYGFEWTPAEMAMYVDGEKYWTMDTTKSFDSDPDTTVYNQPLYLMLTAGAFTPSSTWEAYSGCQVDHGSLPLDFSVDYVRLYQDQNVKGTQLNLAK